MKRFYFILSKNVGPLIDIDLSRIGRNCYRSYRNNFPSLSLEKDAEGFTTTTPAPSVKTLMASIEDERSKAGFVFEEAVTPNLKLKMSLNSISAVFQSKFQSIQVINTTEFGQTLVTDGKTQSAAADEAVYHESLVHPAMIKASLSLGRPVERVYIGGGGELATAREVLRYPGVKEVVMVDIDEEVSLERFSVYMYVAKKKNSR